MRKQDSSWRLYRLAMDYPDRRDYFVNEGRAQEYLEYLEERKTNMPINRPCYDPPNPHDCLIRHEHRFDDGAYGDEVWIVGGIFTDMKFEYYDLRPALAKVSNRIAHHLPMRTADGSWLGES